MDDANPTETPPDGIDHPPLQPFELSIDQAAYHLHDGLWDSTQATKGAIKEALIRAVENGELIPVRGTLQPCPWEVPPVVLKAEDVGAWADRVGLALEGNGSWASYMFNEADLANALDDRLRALRMVGPQSVDASIDSEAIHDQMLALMDENMRLRREIGTGEPDPRHRRTLLRIIGALLDLAEIDPEEAPKTTAHAINAKLELKIGRGMKADTIADVIKAARAID